MRESTGCSTRVEEVSATDDLPGPSRGPIMVVGMYFLLPMDGVGERFRASKNKGAVITAVAILSHNENAEKGNQERTHDPYAVLIRPG